MLSNKFILHSNYTPAGDQLEAIARLISGVEEGATHQTLQGITGSGKTFTMANIIHRLKRPTLILAPNKTLTAQLYDEMKRFFPENAVEYFVSYYDYFQPEVYIPGNDRFIKKDSAINEQLERLRLSTTKALIERRDVIVVASVSSIYGLGHPDQYRALQIPLSLGQEIGHDEFIRRLLLLQYERSEKTLKRAMFRVTGNVFDIFPADSEYLAVRVSITDDIIQTLQWVDPVTGKVIGDITHYLVSPKTLFATPKNSVDLAAKEILAEMEEQIKVFNKENRFVEAERLHGRVTHDVEMMKQVGYCSGIENYSSYLSDRDPNLPPTTLMDYFFCISPIKFPNNFHFLRYSSINSSISSVMLKSILSTSIETFAYPSSNVIRVIGVSFLANKFSPSSEIFNKDIFSLIMLHSLFNKIF